MFKRLWPSVTVDESQKMKNSKQVSRRLFCSALTVMALTACQSGPAPRSAELTSSQVTALRQLGFQEEADGWTFNLSDGKLLFDFGSDTLSAQGKEVVSNIALVLIKIGLTHIRAEGHTDNVGSQEFNKALSLRRAEHVAQQLIGNGFQNNRVLRSGFGPSKPVADNNSAEGRAQNRRVALIIVVE